MCRSSVAALTLLLFLAGAAVGQVCCDDLGVGAVVGVMQPAGGDEDFEDSGFILGVQIKKLVSDRVSVAFDYRRGVTQSGESQTMEAQLLGSRFAGWGEAESFRTVWNYAGISAVVNLMPEGRLVPFVSGGLGLTFWEVQDWREDAADMGGVPDGYDTDGRHRMLEGTNVTAVLGAGLEYFTTERLAVVVGGRYHILFQNEKDNVGLSAVDGPNYVDANNSVLEGYVGLMYYFGPADCDGDGIFGSEDKCHRDAEDFDGFEDDDGCPDPDNDGDGILDEDDQCPDDPEDFDGFEDDDGCPDVDRDGDGIPDLEDACPDDPEDLDGFADEDGCPDPDNDGDGVPDAVDLCPNTPRATVVDATGCPPPKPKATLVAMMVHFELGRAELTGEAMAKLDALAAKLIADPDYSMDIAGFTCDLGTPEYNETLSEWRAEAVVAYLAMKGVGGDRMSVVWFGEMQPLMPNDSEANRKENRRVMITPSRP